MTRRNVYTGKVLGEDPTIAIWQSANELGGYFFRYGGPPLETWTREIADLMKSLAPHAIIGDGAC